MIIPWFKILILFKELRNLQSTEEKNHKFMQWYMKYLCNFTIVSVTKKKFMVHERVRINKFLNFEYNLKLTTKGIYFIPIIVGI